MSAFASQMKLISLPWQKYKTLPGWQKFREGVKGLCQKVWTRTKILSPYIRYFVTILRFVAIYALFGRLWGNEVLFWVKNGVSWARSALLGVVHILSNHG